MSVDENPDLSPPDYAELFAVAFDQGGLGVGVSDSNGVLTLLNSAWTEMLGYEREEMLGRSLYEFLHPDDKAESAERFTQLVSGAVKNYRTERRFIGKSGKVVWADLSVSPMFAADGSLKAVAAFGHDITEQKEAERALRKYQQQMSDLLTATHEGYWLVGNDGRTIDANPAMCKILGRPLGKILGKTIYDFVDAENAAIFERELETRREGKATAYEIALQRPDGSNVPCVNNGTPVYDEDGNKLGSVGLWTDITWMDKAREAEAANAAKSEFLATMSHELRTPLNGVLGMARIMRSGNLDEEQEEQVDVIVESGEILLTLLNDILDVSKIEQGQIEIGSLDFDLFESFMPLFGLWKPVASAKDLSLDSNCDAIVNPMMKGDPTRIRQILSNLISNALKFTDHGGVTVSGAQRLLEDGRMETRFSVADTGVGIDPAIHHKLFPKFSQGDGSLARQYDGAGLGLAICKGLANAMGGDIGFDSVAGKGTTFWFTVVTEIGDPQNLVQERAGTTDEPSSSGHGHRVLVVEDNEINQLLIRTMLLKSGYDVDIAENGREAVDAVTRGPYDLVLMDVQMPVMDGVTATRRIREMPAPTGSIPIVAVTANAMKGDREAYLNAGMNDYVSKPIDPAKLGEAMRRHLGGDATIGPLALADGALCGALKDVASLDAGDDGIQALFDTLDTAIDSMN